MSEWIIQNSKHDHHAFRYRIVVSLTAWCCWDNNNFVTIWSLCLWAFCNQFIIIFNGYSPDWLSGWVRHLWRFYNKRQGISLFISYRFEKPSNLEANSKKQGSFLMRIGDVCWRCIDVTAYSLRRKFNEPWPLNAGEMSQHQHYGSVLKPLCWLHVLIIIFLLINIDDNEIYEGNTSPLDHFQRFSDHYLYSAVITWRNEIPNEHCYLSLVRRRKVNISK